MCSQVTVKNLEANFVLARMRALLGVEAWLFVLNATTNDMVFILSLLYRQPFRIRYTLFSHLLNCLGLGTSKPRMIDSYQRHVYMFVFTVCLPLGLVRTRPAYTRSQHDGSYH